MLYFKDDFEINEHFNTKTYVKRFLSFQERKLKTCSSSSHRPANECQAPPPPYACINKLYYLHPDKCKQGRRVNHILNVIKAAVLKISRFFNGTKMYEVTDWHAIFPK